MKRKFIYPLLIISFIIFPLLVQAVSITLSPISGFSAITISGTAFTSWSSIDFVSWDGQVIPTVPYSVSLDAWGNFSLVISVPTQTSTGNHIVRVVDNDRSEASAYFQVINMTGPQGQQGSTGLQGNQGLQGEQGPAGIQGLEGSQGFQGEQGPAGIQGLEGSQGSRGEQGLSGTGFAQEDILRVQEFLEQDGFEKEEPLEKQELPKELIISIIAIVLALVSLGLTFFRKILSKNP